MKIRKLLRILHRDFGYFIVGMTVVYALSGIYLNHRHDFNPDYKIFFTEFQTDITPQAEIDETAVRRALENQERDVVYKKHYINGQGRIKVFIENGEAIIDPETGEASMSYLQRRPIIFEMNKLHKAFIGIFWKWVSDVMAVILIFVVVFGLFIFKGKCGLTRWGWWFTIGGIIVPILFALLYI